MMHKTNAEGYSKDLNSGVVVNTNNRDYSAYIQERERIKQMRDVQNEITWLKKEFAELRELFKEFCEKK
jgi:serine/threonine-protein kinase RIO1